MTQIDWEQLAKDREAGTPGNWDTKGKHKRSTDFGVFSATHRAICSAGGYQDGQPDTHEENKANARRIARVPDLEAYALSANRQLEAAEALADRVRKAQNGWPHKPGWIEDALAAYEAAKGGE